MHPEVYPYYRKTLYLETIKYKNKTKDERIVCKRIRNATQRERDVTILRSFFCVLEMCMWGRGIKESIEGTVKVVFTFIVKVDHLYSLWVWIFITWIALHIIFCGFNM